MKKLITFCCLAFAISVNAQTSVSPINTVPVKTVPMDKSPMDMSYFPVDYPMAKTQSKTVQPPVARVVYSRPQRDNRKIFGELVEYNQVWRLGANESTELEFFRDVTINNKKIPKGRYTLYAIPTPDQWTIILNKDTDSWGAFIYDAKKDVCRITIPVQNLTTPVDALTINFVPAPQGTNLVMSWDTVSAVLPIGFK